MIKEYLEGTSFIKENGTYLEENKHMSALFFIDAPLLKEVNSKNYALRAYKGDKKLLGLKLEPYNLMLYGDKECLEELLDFIKDKDYELLGIMAPSTVGDELIRITNSEYHLTLGMDYMKATEIKEPSDKEVKRVTLEDVDEIIELSSKFFKECGLQDKPNPDLVKERIDTYRVIKKEGKIIALARMGKDTEDSQRITMVYTRPEYRGQKLARRVVNTLKNEIIEMGKAATLNVDQANPISYHLYTSLGFKKLFSQGIYEKN